MATAAKQEETAGACPVRAFSVEADHPRNCDLLFQGVQGMRLRSRIISSRTVKDAKTGEETVPGDQAQSLGRYPEIPGMILSVNPGKLAYKVSDPLVNDADLCRKIKRQMDRQQLFRTDTELRGVPEQSASLSEDRMKTLCREIWHMIKNGYVRVVKGTAPTMDDIDKLPGRYLLNPGSMIQNYQPQYEEDLADWVQTLNRMG